jgi:predicted enzyme related to lactoylglutathione lyase
MKLRNKIKYFFPSFALITLLYSCNENKNNSEIKSLTNTKEVKMDKLTPKVTGIGGIFFRTKDPKATREWYGKNLGLATSDYGSSFEFRNANRPDEINYLSWSPFEEDTKYFEPSEKEFMINYRVQNIEGLIKQLKENGVTVLDEIEEYDYGKFVHILDLEGNKIELWEPVDSVFTKMGGPTTK